MKRIKNILKSNVFAFVVGAVIFSSIGVTAATILNGTDIQYTGTKVSGATNIQQAIDGLYDRASNIHTDCASGFIKGNIAADGSYTCSLPQPICKRATTLHNTETCEQTSQYCALDGYSKGATITYGNLGTTGTLATGDAFDCDVNGDEKYDAATERFYYVSDAWRNGSFDSNTAFLIYYNDYVTTPVAYDAGGDAYTNGPVTAIANLPTTTTDWPNVSLTNSVRDIYNEKGKVKKSGFDYGNKAARLITYQEINAGCYDGTTDINLVAGLSSKCKFLMENTRYSNSSNPIYNIWTETASSSDYYRAWLISSRYRQMSSGYANTESSYGARPGIEVLKSLISY